MDGSPAGPQNARTIVNAIVLATIVAGTLDILSAFVFAGIGGVPPLSVLRFVASGPFGDAPTASAGWGAVGLAVHYAIMACMASAYMLIAPRIGLLIRHPILSGVVYGFLLWIIMYWIVLALRYPELPRPHTLYGIANQLFSHCILVGLPIALVATRFFGASSVPAGSRATGS
jgi:hypothetical protein